jgi:hypothetical protein
MGRPHRANGEKNNAYMIFVGNPKGRRPLARPRLMGLNNIKTDHMKIEWGCMDWSDLAQERHKWRVLVNTVMKLRVP